MILENMIYKTKNGQLWRLLKKGEARIGVCEVPRWESFHNTTVFSMREISQGQGNLGFFYESELEAVAVEMTDVRPHTLTGNEFQMLQSLFEAADFHKNADFNISSEPIVERVLRLRDVIRTREQSEHTDAVLNSEFQAAGLT